MKDSVNDKIINNKADLRDVALKELDFTEYLQEDLNFLEATSIEVSGRGYRFYLGFDREEERFIFTVDAGENFKNIDTLLAELKSRLIV